MKVGKTEDKVWRGQIKVDLFGGWEGENETGKVAGLWELTLGWETYECRCIPDVLCWVLVIGAELLLLCDAVFPPWNGDSQRKWRLDQTRFWGEETCT